MGQGMAVRPFTITRWLGDHESLFLSDRAHDADNELRILHIPGHCIDHLAVWFPREKRLFVGDTVYPFTALVVSALGAKLPDYVASLQKLRDHAAAAVSREDTVPGGSAPSSGDTTLSGDCSGSQAPPPANDEPARENSAREELALEEFAREDTARENPANEESTPLATDPTRETMARSMVEDILGIDWDTATANFDPVRLLELSDDNMDDAVNLFVSCGESIGQVAPPRPARALDPSGTSGGSGGASVGRGGGSAEALPEFGAGRRLPAPAAPVTVTLACGHVDAAMEAVPALDELLEFLEMVRAGAVEPVRVDEEDESVEYAQQRFAIVLPRNAQWEPA